MTGKKHNPRPRRIIFPRQGCVELCPFDMPELGPDEVLVRTHFSLISVGTETTILNGAYAADSHFARIFSFPQLKTGVLAAGEVLQVGPSVTEFQEGARVFMRMAHGSHQVVSAAALSPIPEELSLRDACWCGLAKTAFRAAWAARFSPEMSVLVIGAGPVGQMLVRWARTQQVERLIAIDLSAGRLEHAVCGGATDLICGSIFDSQDKIAALTDGMGPDVVVDCTGNAAVFAAALGAARRYGKVLLLGDSGFPGKQCLTSDVMTKGLTIQATHESHDRDGWNQRRIDERFFSLVSDGAFDLAGLISHEFSPTECKLAYDLACNRRSEALGILFNWQP